MKRTLREIYKELKKKENDKPNKDILQEYMELFEAKRREHGYINEYEVLVEAGAIEAVKVPDNAVNLFPYMKEKHMRVKEALELPENQEIIQEAKLKAEQESIYYN